MTSTLAHTSKHSPQVSIIMPVYNGELFIQESIESVISQTYTDWELLIIDDGSTDQTKQKVEQFDDPRIRYFSIPHCGYDGAVRNYGLEQVKGAYIAFLDADDLYLSNSLQIRLEYLQAHSECTAVYGFYDLIDEEGHSPYFNHSLLHTSIEVNWQKILTGETSTFLQGLMLPIESLKRIGRFEEDLLISSDHVFYIRLYLDNFKGVQSIPYPVFKYRVHVQSLTKSTERFYQTLKSYNTIFRRFFSLPGLPLFSSNEQSKICVRILQNAIRGRVNTGQKKLASEIIRFSFSNPFIYKQDALKYCMPYYVRIILPDWSERILYQVFQALKKIKSGNHNLYKVRTHVSS